MCNIQDEVFHKVGPDDLHTEREELFRKTTADTDTWQPGDARRFQQRIGNLAEHRMVFTRSHRQCRGRACWSDYHVNLFECSCEILDDECSYFLSFCVVCIIIACR